MASYEMQESNLPNEEGKRVLFPRMKLWGQTDLDEISRKISRATTFTPGDVKGLVQAFVEEMAAEMADGKSVKIDGIGIFIPALGLRDGFDRESGEEGDTRRNATSIYLKDIHFRVDKELLTQTARRCHLERSTWKFRKSSTRYTPEERLALAQQFLDTHPFLTVADYMQLTGLLRVTAAKELNRWKEDPSSGIGSRGRGSHKVYVRKEA